MNSTVRPRKAPITPQKLSRPLVSGRLDRPLVEWEPEDVDAYLDGLIRFVLLEEGGVVS